MRFIIREQEYERLKAAGRFRYEAPDHLVGTSEAWRYTVVDSGYGFVRIDLDQRESSAGSSTLYHLALDPEQRILRVKFRHFVGMSEIVGNVQIDEDYMALSRIVNGRRLENELKVGQEFKFWLATMVGVSLLCKGNARKEAFPAISLDNQNEFNLKDQWVKTTLRDKERIEVAGQSMIVQRCLITVGGQDEIVWLDDHLWPVSVNRADGTRAIDIQPIRY